MQMEGMPQAAKDWADGRHFSSSWQSTDTIGPGTFLSSPMRQASAPSEQAGDTLDFFRMQTLDFDGLPNLTSQPAAGSRLTDDLLPDVPPEDLDLSLLHMDEQPQPWDVPGISSPEIPAAACWHSAPVPAPLHSEPWQRSAPWQQQPSSHATSMIPVPMPPHFSGSWGAGHHTAPQPIKTQGGFGGGCDWMPAQQQVSHLGDKDVSRSVPHHGMMVSGSPLSSADDTAFGSAPQPRTLHYSPRHSSGRHPGGMFHDGSAYLDEGSILDSPQASGDSSTPTGSPRGSSMATSASSSDASRSYSQLSAAAGSSAKTPAPLQSLTRAIAKSRSGRPLKPQAKLLDALQMSPSASGGSGRDGSFLPAHQRPGYTVSVGRAGAGVAASKRKRTILPPAALRDAEADFGQRRKQHNPWTREETEALVQGVEHCGGAGHWQDIKRLGYRAIAGRSAVDLKDKWRNLLRIAELPPALAHARVDKKREAPSLEILERVRALAAASAARASASETRVMSSRARGRGRSTR